MIKLSDKSDLNNDVLDALSGVQKTVRFVSAEYSNILLTPNYTCVFQAMQPTINNDWQIIGGIPVSKVALKNLIIFFKFDSYIHTRRINNTWIQYGTQSTVKRALESGEHYIGNFPINTQLNFMVDFPFDTTQCNYSITIVYNT